MNPDSTTPALEEPPLEEEADLPGFDPTTSPRQLDPLDPSTTTITDPPPSPLEEEPADVDESDRSEPISPKQERTSPLSAGDPGVADAAAGLFMLFATLGAYVLDKTLGRKSGAYLMRDREAEAIGVPLGRIAARRAPVDVDAKDASDGLQAGVAAASHAARASMQHFGTATEEPQS